jgi:hypothetical protein
MMEGVWSIAYGPPLADSGAHEYECSVDRADV